MSMNVFKKNNYRNTFTNYSIYLYYHHRYPFTNCFFHSMLYSEILNHFKCCEYTTGFIFLIVLNISLCLLCAFGRIFHNTKPKNMFSTSLDMPNCSPKWLCQFVFPPELNRYFHFPILLPTFSIIRLYYYYY